MQKLSLFNENWDNVAKVPYLTGKDGLNTFISYDDLQSIELKAQFIVEKQLRGAIIWEITGDYIETFPGSGQVSGTPLVSKLVSLSVKLIFEVVSGTWLIHTNIFI